jgi:serine/threonine-protein kinase RsbW
MPATPQLMRVARLTAAGLASRLGFSFDEIEDVKIAVDELCFALMGTRGREGSLTLVYRLDADRLVIEGTGELPAPGAGAEANPATTELSSRILSAVVDEHQVDSRDGATRFRLTKRRAATA